MCQFFAGNSIMTLPRPGQNHNKRHSLHSDPRIPSWSLLILFSPVTYGALTLILSLIYLNYSLITLPSLMVLLFYQLPCFPWALPNSLPHEGLWIGLSLCMKNVTPHSVIVPACSPWNLCLNVTFSRRPPI